MAREKRAPGGEVLADGEQSWELGAGRWMLDAGCWAQRHWPDQSYLCTAKMKSLLVQREW